MIRTAILGAGTKEAGELIRILVNHPDTEVVCLADPLLAGRKAADIHHGLIGDTDMAFTAEADVDSADVIFLCADSDMARAIRRLPVLPDSPRIIDMCGGKLSGYEGEGFVPAVSELFRKPLVRGARRAMVIHPALSLATVALGPLASGMLLAGSLRLRLSMPEDILRAFDKESFAGDLELLLSGFQKSWCGSIETETESSSRERGMLLDAEMTTSVPVQEIAGIYESIYDDHNFSFLKPGEPLPEDAEGTQKVIIHPSQLQGGIRIQAVADARLRGGAGDAVHAMNLLFALHEKTALSLKASSF